MKKAFTLLEIMIVIAIMGILATLISGNLINSMKRGRDAKRKEDLHQIQKALEMYYEDNSAYPVTLTFGSALTHPDASLNRIYMQKLPTDPSSNYSYKYFGDMLSGSAKVNAYRLYSALENDQDSGPDTNNPNGYAGTECCATCTGIAKTCKFGLASYNEILPTNDVSGGVGDCTPNCTNKCGGASDGCSGSCNTCPGGNFCVGQTCVGPTSIPTAVPTAVPTIAPTAVPTAAPGCVADCTNKCGGSSDGCGGVCNGGCQIGSNCDFRGCTPIYVCNNGFCCQRTGCQNKCSGTDGCGGFCNTSCGEMSCIGGLCQ